jgi:hypothetical protein
MGEGTSQNVGWDYATIYFVNILGMPCSFLSIFLEKKFFRK